MSEVQTENDLSSWLSTYGLITAERILERYQIRLQYDELISAVKNPTNMYHRLLYLPLNNVRNNIILQQAIDYQIYAQKLFIDYLISGESDKPAEAPGGLVREDLEAERTKLVSMGDDFHANEVKHKRLIAECQKNLMHHASAWQKYYTENANEVKSRLQANGLNMDDSIAAKIMSALRAKVEFTQQEITNLPQETIPVIEKMLGQSLSFEIQSIFIEQLNRLREVVIKVDPLINELTPKVQEMNASLREWRLSFYNIILRVNELIKLLPEYRSDEAKDMKNKESLLFNTDMGEKEKQE